MFLQSYLVEQLKDYLKLLKKKIHVEFEKFLKHQFRIIHVVGGQLIRNYLIEHFHYLVL